MHLTQLLLKNIQSNHRSIIILGGDKERLSIAYKQVRTHLAKPALILGEHLGLEHNIHPNDEFLNGANFRLKLGTQTDVLVWTLGNDLHHDAAAASSGCLTGGGILLVLDPKPARYEPSIDRLKRFLKETDSTISIDVDITPEIHLDHFPTDSGTEKIEGASIALTSEQQDAIRQLTSVVSGHRKRPLVLQADRGRGKSTALGFGLASLVNRGTLTSALLISNRQDHTEALLSHYLSELNDKSGIDKLLVLPSDQALESLPETQLLVIDEAASFPIATLEKLLAQYSRVAMASTLHGYEGSGRGFQLKLNQIFEKLALRPRHIKLTQALRWSSGDALETAIDQCYAMNFDSKPVDISESDNSIPAVRWMPAAELAQDESLLRQVFALLVQAHYQTRPSDLAQLLDQDQMFIALLELNNNVLGAALCLEESIHPPERENPELLESVINGERRLKGHLFTQSIASFNANPEWFELSTLRVMRIVIQPEQQSRGYGNTLLKAVAMHTANAGHDGVSVSFGISPRLLQFWSRNHFIPLKLSYKPDAASGLNSIMMFLPHSTRAKTLCGEGLQRFYQHLIAGLPSLYPKTDLESLIALLALNCMQAFAPSLNKTQQGKVKRFANARYPLWDCWPELQTTILALVVGKGKTGNPPLVLFGHVLMNLSHERLGQFQGKKDFETHLRAECLALLKGAGN